MFKVCKKCYMPDTRPNTPFKDGICQACINYETRKNVDWKRRMDELREICDKYRSNDSSWDVIVPVSGGKDSITMVYLLKEVMKMHPLLLTLEDPFGKTKAGIHNRNNIAETFNADHMLFTLSPDFHKRVVRYCFEKWLDPLRYVEQLITVYPLTMSVKLGIPFRFMGEGYFIYGEHQKEALESTDIVYKEYSRFNVDFWIEQGFKRDELNSIIPPAREEIDRVKPFTAPMGYFQPWSSVYNRQIAIRFGFEDLAHEWKREGCMEDFEQIDSKGYLVHLWLKYPKFGFQRTTDIASRRLRDGVITKEEAKKYIRERDHVLDQVALTDFCNTLGYTRREFWEIVEGFWNKDIFEKDKNGLTWRMKVERFPD